MYPPEMRNPGCGRAGAREENRTGKADQRESTPPTTAKQERKPRLRLRVGDEADLFAGREIELSGRCAWMAERLIEAGRRGVTTAELPPGVRVSDYIMKLRRRGLGIETRGERHGGQFPGRHGAYVLTSPVTILSEAK